MALEPKRRRITAAEYHRMVEAGILRPDEHVELLYGEIIAMPPSGEPHRRAINRLNYLLAKMFADRAFVQVQLPLHASEESEPEPDVMLLASSEAAWGNRPPTPAEALAVVEVSLSSRNFDRRVKAQLYAESGIPDYWIVDLVDRVVRINRDPSPGGYRTTTLARLGDRIAFAAFPDDPIVIDEALLQAP